ncbi:MAG: hypothetical protein L0287_04710, partial [Anaerolineae bacterium]|nr:hypothetical protein [Anaerolineae bacterium]
YKGVQRALSAVQAALSAGIDEEDFLEEDQDLIIAAINTGDIEPVKTLNTKYKVLEGLPPLTAVYAG